MKYLDQILYYLVDISLEEYFVSWFLMKSRYLGEVMLHKSAGFPKERISYTGFMDLS